MVTAAWNQLIVFLYVGSNIVISHVQAARLTCAERARCECLLILSGADAGPEEAGVIPVLGRGLRRKASAVVVVDGEGGGSRRGVKSRRGDDSDNPDDATVVIPDIPSKPGKVGRLVSEVPVCYETIRAREAVRRQAMVRPHPL